MKNILFLALLSIFIISCDKETKLEGEYFKVMENDRGAALNPFQKGLVSKVNFGDKMCRFDYFGTTMSGEYRVDRNFVYINVGGELGTLSMEIIDDNTLEGEGWISGTFKKK